MVEQQPLHHIGLAAVVRGGCALKEFFKAARHAEAHDYAFVRTHQGTVTAGLIHCIAECYTGASLRRKAKEAPKLHVISAVRLPTHSAAFAAIAREASALPLDRASRRRRVPFRQVDPLNPCAVAFFLLWPTQFNAVSQPRISSAAGGRTSRSELRRPSDRDASTLTPTRSMLLCSHSAAFRRVAAFSPTRSVWAKPLKLAWCLLSCARRASAGC